MSQSKTTRLSHLDFVTKAIKASQSDKSKGIHSVYSGFNTAFRNYYGKDYDPVETVNKLVTDGKLVTHFVRGGVMIYLPQDAPERTNNGDKGLLKAMGLS